MVNPGKRSPRAFLSYSRARYMLFWMALNNAQCHSYIDLIAATEENRI
jgi:hypothetical protein